MKKHSSGVVILFLVVLSLTGCQLAQEGGEISESGNNQLVGVLITTEYLDLFDFEAYFNDNAGELLNGNTTIDPAEARAYEGRLYAVAEPTEKDGEVNYQFPGVEGIPFYYIPVVTDMAEPAEGEEYDWAWTPGESTAIQDQYAALSVKDDAEEISLEGTLYISSQSKNHRFYGNPIYRTPEGELYATAGSGISSDWQDGGSMSQTLEETYTLTLGEKQTQEHFKVTFTITSVDPVENIVLLQMDENNRVLSRQEFQPGQVPESLTPEQKTSYILVESHHRNQKGVSTIDRDLYDREDEILTTYQEQEEGYFTRLDTQLAWPNQ